MCAGSGGETAAYFDTLLATVLAPIVEVCERSASSLPPGELSAEPTIDTHPSASGSGGDGGAASAAAPMPPNADRMYLINCLLAVWSPLSLHKPSAAHAARLRRRVDEEVLRPVGGSVLKAHVPTHR